MAKTLPFKVPAVKLAIEIHYHQTKKCTASSHDSTCKGRGPMVSCIERSAQISTKPPVTVTYFECTHARIFKR